MTPNLPPRVVVSRGITLLELTIVIIVLLALVSLLIVGSRVWKRGGERASCILTLRNMQVAARSYQNIHGYDCGERPSMENGTRDISRHLHAKGYIGNSLFDRARGAEGCPSSGNYNCPLPEVFPAPGELYMNCSLSASADHQPASLANW